MASNINRVIVSGNLTKDPESRPAGNGTVCQLRIAVNGRRRNAEGTWEDVPNYFTVNVWGGQGENCQRYLSKGRGVVVDGELRWREFTSEQHPERGKQERVEIAAVNVQFLPSGNGSQSSSAPSADIPVDTSDFQPASRGDDDIPF